MCVSKTVKACFGGVIDSALARAAHWQYMYIYIWPLHFDACNCSLSWSQGHSSTRSWHQKCLQNALFLMSQLESNQVHVSCWLQRCSYQLKHVKYIMHNIVTCCMLAYRPAAADSIQNWLSYNPKHSHGIMQEACFLDWKQQHQETCWACIHVCTELS